MKAASCALIILAMAGAARAEDGPKPICADRPNKGTSACIVDRGHWQVESDLANYTHDRAAGAETLILAGTSLKYGLTDRLDVELNITPWQMQAQTGQGRRQGFGDMIARAKIALIPGDSAVSVQPWIKLPTAGAGLGNGAVEGGLLAPISLSLPAGIGLGLTPEIDALKDDGGNGRHIAYALSAGLSHAVTQELTGTVELWGQENDDPSGHLRQASVDLGVAWIPMKDQNLQLDGGVNLGLNRQTPGEQVYIGLSRRF